MAKLEIEWKKVVIEVVKALLYALLGAGGTYAAMPELFLKMDELVKAGSEMVDRMAMRRNEWRDWMGLEPDPDMDELLALPGVGRKIANLLRGDIFGLGGIVADTHCIRISGRLGLSNGKDPLKTERDLEKLIPIEKQSDYCHRMVLFGREVCIARRPKCDECVMNAFCTHALNK